MTLDSDGSDWIKLNLWIFSLEEKRKSRYFKVVRELSHSQRLIEQMGVFIKFLLVREGIAIKISGQSPLLKLGSWIA